MAEEPVAAGDIPPRDGTREICEENHMQIRSTLHVNSFCEMLSDL